MTDSLPDFDLARFEDLTEGRPHDWEPVAAEVLAAIERRVAQTVRKAADEMYEDVLTATQDYLTDNATFNIAIRIQTADREAASARSALTRSQLVSSLLLDACRVAIGHLTGGMDGDWRDCDPVEVLRSAIASAEKP